MSSRSLLLVAALLVTLILGAGPAAADPGGPQTPAVPVGTAFTYQGQLKNGSAGVTGACDVAFRLFDDSGAGVQIGPALTPTVVITSGLFTTALDFGPGVFTGDARWLDLAVRCPAGSGSFTPLTPRQPLTPAPYALALPGLRTVQNGFIPSVLGGYSGNSVGPAVSGAVVTGGGEPGNGCAGPCSNRALSSWATVSGGFGNLAGAGGVDAFETVGGGAGNTATADSATVAGGNQNTASNQEATVGGGRHNQATGYAATVPGGEFNSAGGDYSLAAGRNAHADGTSSFVWADTSTLSALHSTGDNQFIVRAAGGVGINTDSPAAALDVHANASGSLRVSTGTTPGTIFAAIQGGNALLGTGVSGVNVFTITFPSAYSAVPHVVVTPRGVVDASDTFVASTRRITTSYFVVNVVRQDPPFAGTGWGQALQLDWYAWQ